MTDAIGVHTPTPIFRRKMYCACFSTHLSPPKVSSHNVRTNARRTTAQTGRSTRIHEMPVERYRICAACAFRSCQLDSRATARAQRQIHQRQQDRPASAPHASQSKDKRTNCADYSQHKLPVARVVARRTIATPEIQRPAQRSPATSACARSVDAAFQLSPRSFERAAADQNQRRAQQQNARHRRAAANRSPTPRARCRRCSAP